MRIIITGDREEIYFMIKLFLKEGHDLTYINRDFNVCKKISRTYETCDVVCGDPTNLNVLEEAEAFQANLVIASGKQDADNLIVCQMVKSLYETERTLAIVNDSKNIETFKMLGVDVVVSTANTIFSMIAKNISAEKINNIINLEEQRASIVEVLISQEDKVVGKKIVELNLPKTFLIACILRKERAIIPRGDTEMKASDKLILVTLEDSKSKVHEMFKGGQTV